LSFAPRCSAAAYLAGAAKSSSSKEKYVHCPFELCLVDWIENSTKKDRSSVSITLNHDGLFLTPHHIEEYPLGDTFKNIPFEHYEDCPMRVLTMENKFQIPKRVKVGVSVLIENENKKILITRRSKNLRTFPGVWVLPGGHCEKGESFFQTGSREVLEETGIYLLPENLSIFLVYESVFPVVLSEGFPSDHHVVIYLHGVVNIKEDDLKLCTQEVDMVAWISSDDIKNALHYEEHKPPLFFEVLEFSESEAILK